MALELFCRLLWLPTVVLGGCTGGHCTQGDLLLQVGRGRLSSGESPCGHSFCEALREGSWCKDNGLCHWTDVPCRCSSGTTTTGSTGTVPTRVTTTTEVTTTTTSTPSTTPSTGGACGDQLCTSLRPGSWCKANGVCQWTDAPCRCTVTSSVPTTTGAATTSTSTTSASTTSTSTTFTTGSHLQQYVEVPKAIYVWNPGDLSHPWWDWTMGHIDLLLSVCEAHGFGRAIVFIGSVQWDWQQHFSVGKLPHQEKFVTLFAELRKAGVMPYACFYLNDSPNDLSNWERAADVVSAVHKFNKAFPGSKIEGLDGDQEPTLVSEEYLQMNHAMMARRDQLQSQLHLAVSIKPGWLRGEAPGAARVLESVDAGMVMAYSREAATSQLWGDIALALGPCSVALETSFRAPSADSFWQMASQEPLKFFQLMVDMDHHYRAGQFASEFHGMVVHDYEGFFKAMYGVPATSFTGQVEGLHG